MVIFGLWYEKDFINYHCAFFGIHDLVLVFKAAGLSSQF